MTPRRGKPTDRKDKELDSRVSMLDRPRDSAASTKKNTTASHAPTNAELLDDVLNELRSSTLSTFADGLDDSSPLKSLLVKFSREPGLQLTAFLVIVVAVSIILVIVIPDPSHWDPFNFLFFLAYFVAAIFFAKYSALHTIATCAAMSATAILLNVAGLSHFRPTIYFLAALCVVGLVDTALNLRYITKAAEQALSLRRLRREIMDRDAQQPGRGSARHLDRDMDAFKERELSFRRQQLLFSELFMHLRSLSVSLNEKELFASLHFLLAKGLNVEAMEVFFLDEDETHLFVADAAALDTENRLQKTTVELRLPHDGQNIPSKCAQEGRTFSADDIDRDIVLKGLKDHGHHPTVYCAPLMADNRIRGVLNISQTSKPSLDDMEKKLFVAVAAVAGASLTNAKTFLLTQEELRDKESISEQEKQERIKTRNLLDRIMDRKIVEEIMRNPDRTFSDRIKVTTLLADVRGFTALSENLNPREVVEILNGFFSALTPVIFKYDGTLDKYIGDEIMALFGPPKPRGNHAEMAILCALEMRTAFRKLQSRWKKEKNLDLEMGIALNTGDAIVGFIGSENLTNYTAIGDSVNTAARLEDVTPAGKIFITESTYQEVADFVEARLVSAASFKGKKHMVNCYEVVSLKTHGQVRKPPAPAKATPEPRRAIQAPTVSPPAVAPPARPPSRPASTKAQPTNARMSGKFCRMCGGKIPPGVASCTKCGTPI